MIDLFQKADPAAGLEANTSRLRAKVDERIGLSTSLRTAPPARSRRPWLIAAVSFAAVIALALPALLREETSIFSPQIGGIDDLPGVEKVVPLASGGVQTAGTDGVTIWVMTSLQDSLQRVSATSGRIEATYTIDRYTEGVAVGGGYVWLRGYDNGGEVLRFNPQTGMVDKIIAAGEPAHGWRWFSDSLWVSNNMGQTLRISADGEVVATFEGELKGDGLGYLWIADNDTGEISSLSGDGIVGEIVVPADATITPDGSGIREVTSAGGYLWLMDDDIPNGSSVTRFDPATGEVRPLPVAPGLLDMLEFDGFLWVTSNRDHLLVKIDPESGELTRYPMPGKAGGLLVSNGSLWVTLYHPGVLVKLDTKAGLIEAGDVVADIVSDGHRLLCTAGEGASGPTVVLLPMDWINYGSWSVIQAELSDAGHTVCAVGDLTPPSEGALSPSENATAVGELLDGAGIFGPYLLVANGDAVHSARIFADGRDDIAGVVLVDPMPLGFGAFMDDLFGEGGRPPWLDLSPEESSALSGFGSAPLVVMGQDPKAVYLSDQFVKAFGAETANQINDFWQEGLEFYAGLSTDSTSVVWTGAGMDYGLFYEPNQVVSEVLEVAAR